MAVEAANMPIEAMDHLKHSTQLLKSLQPAICLPISILLNKSMETGQVQANMKIAKIIPFINPRKTRSALEKMRG